MSHRRNRKQSKTRLFKTFRRRIKMIWLACAAMWLSVGGSVIYAIYATGKISPLFFLIIPLFVSFSTENSKIKENKGELK